MSNLLDDILRDQGLNYEDLNSVEKETYNKSNFSVQKLTVEDVKTYVANMKNSIALQLADTTFQNSADEEKNTLLKARLKNYILFEAFLLRPELAAEAFQKAIESSKKDNE